MKIVQSLLFLLIFSSIEFTVNSCSETETNSIELDMHELTLEVGESATLTVVNAPDIDDPVEWSSSDNSVASVFFGKVTALSSGEATIVVQMGEFADSCVVTIPEREYTLVWAEEFDGTSLNTDIWNIEVNGRGGGNNEAQYYTDRSENIRVADGLLTIEARKEEYLGKSYTSGRINTKNNKHFAYGKVEARLKVPKGVGTWPAFWMLGYGSWPGCGEIDIMEHVGYQPKTFHCALHTLNRNGMNGQNEHAQQTLDQDVANEFHVITMEWVENEIQGYDRMHFYVDGLKTASFSETKQLQESGDWPFNDDFFFIVNLAIGGTWGGSQGIDDSMFDNPVLYQVDYIRVYQLQ